MRSTAAARFLLASGGLAIEIYFVFALTQFPVEFLWAVAGYWLYAGCALLLSLSLPVARGWQAAICIAVDMVAALVLYGMTTARSTMGNTLIHAWPVLEAAILGSGYMAALVTVFLTSFMVVLSSIHSGGLFEPEPLALYAALGGLGLLALGTLTHQLMSRIAQQETASVLAERMAARLEAVTRLTLAEMHDGVIVVGHDGQLHSINPAAQRLLGWAGPAPRLLSDLSPAARANDNPLQALAAQSWGQALGRERRIAVPLADGSSIDLLVNCRPVRAAGEDMLLMFLRDARELEAQVHEAKLAGMGRLVAAIAHEIRNPLSAVSQAAQLLREQGSTSLVPAERLTELILTNARRIDATVQDVLALGRRERTPADALDLRRWLEEWHAEYRAIEGTDDAGSVVAVALPEAPMWAGFDAEHLRRVVDNLVGNARRYCSGGVGAIRIELRSAWPDRVELSVANDGPVIEPAARGQLFEPFSSGEARGTGLGLYISRELCVKNGAGLDYRVMPDGRGEFIIAMRPAAGDAAFDLANGRP